MDNATRLQTILVDSPVGAVLPRPRSIPEFVKVWGMLPLSEWPLKLEIKDYKFTDEARLIEPDLDARPTQLCEELAKFSCVGVS